MVTAAVRTLRQHRATVVLRVLKRLFPKAGMMLVHANPWELLAAVILSAQCTDKKVNEVTATLFKKYPALEDYVRAKPREFERDIYQTGFYRNKTKNVLAAAKMVKERFGGVLPKTMAGMLEIPGVARKTANVVLGNVYGVVEGIAVDTHVRRLARLWGLTSEHDPVKIERDLMEVLPKKEWFLFTYRTIEYGRKFCSARAHDHTHCPVSEALGKRR
jgi:endonuclease-3